MWPRLPSTSKTGSVRQTPMLAPTSSVTVSTPNGRIRLSTHVYSTAEQVERAAGIIGPFVDREAEPMP